MIARIVFLQDDEGRAIVDRLCRVEGVIAHGATDATIADAIDHLRQWDYGEDDDVHDQPAHGSRDEVAERDGYILSWNLSLGYVGLERRITDRHALRDTTEKGTS